MPLIRKFYKDLLEVRVYDSEEEMGGASAAFAASVLEKLGGEQDEINILLSTARSQEKMFHALEAERAVPWGKINVFHVDEYIGLRPDNDALLRRQLMDYFFKSVTFGNTFFLDSMTTDVEAECERYASLLRSHPIDISFVGIGDNGHLAFNEPFAADFNDPLWVRQATVDPISKRQLVNHNNFKTAEDVPDFAFTITLTALMSAKYVICTTPFKTKAQACFDALTKDIGNACPATIMRTHRDAVAFLDADSAGLLPDYM